MLERQSEPHNPNTNVMCKRWDTLLYVVCLYLYNAKVRLKALAPRPCLLSPGQGFVWLYEEMNRVSAIAAESANHTRPPQSLNQ